MFWLPYLFWSMYAVSFPLHWYRAKYQFQPGWSRPSILNRDNIVFYQFANLILTLTATGGLWYSYGLITAAVAFGVRFLLFGTVMLRIYYKRALSVEIARNLGVLERESSLDDPKTIAEAVVLARRFIMLSMRGDDYLTPTSGFQEQNRLRREDLAYVPTIEEICLAVRLRDGLRYEDAPPAEDPLRREQYIARFWDRLESERSAILGLSPLTNVQENGS